jgi:hypothetical protein
MSGGHFGYDQYKIAEIVDQIARDIQRNDSTEKDEWGYPISREYSEETIAEFKRAVDLLNKAAIYVNRIDWLLSGDDGEEQFHSRLRKELDTSI